MPYTPFLPAVVRKASGSVFHYTSAQGLLSIMPSGKVWASEASSLNDLAEVRQGWETIFKLLKTFPHSEAQRLLIDSVERPMKATHEVFVLSASTAGDDANQWRLYADGGRGYVLEVDGTVQLTAFSTLPAPTPGKPSKPGRISFQKALDSASVTPWLHVLYKKTEIEEALDELLASVDGEISNINRISEEDEQLFAFEGLRDDAYEALATIAHLIKTPGFSGENEVRVVATFVIRGDQIGYRAGTNGVIGYATLTQAPHGHASSVLRPEPGAPAQTVLPVKSVRLGPLLAKEHENTIRGFLHRHGQRDIAITRSEIPLR